MSELFTLRALAADDLPFVFNSWLKSFRDAPAVQSIPNSIYFAGQHDRIDRILKSAGLAAAVACNPEDPTQIYGYIVAENATVGSVVHWVYVKHPFRGHGVARGLFAAVVGAGTGPVPFYYTHRVKASDRLVRERAATFNPYLLKE